MFNSIGIGYLEHRLSVIVTILHVCEAVHVCV